MINYPSASTQETCIKIFRSRRHVNYKRRKTDIIEKFATKPGDTGSPPQVQIAILSKRISALTDHLRANKHDESSRRGLLRLVGRRRRLLAYLRQKDYDAFLAITEELKIRRK